MPHAKGLKRMRCLRNTGARRTGFTLIELLLVVGLIFILIGIVLYVGGRVLRQSRITSCMNNQRQINMANFNFATDNNGEFMSPRSSGNFTSGTGDESALADCSRGGETNRLFTKSYAGNMDGNSERESALTEGAAWEYLGDLKAYKSPNDPTTRVRSYAINAYVGELCPDNLGGGEDYAAIVNSGWRAARSLSALPQPNNTLMTTCEEDSAGYNNQGFMIKNWLLNGNPPPQHWFDYPAPWLEDGVTTSFCDGSTLFYEFKKKDLGQYLIENSASGSGYHRAYYPGEPTLSSDQWDETNSDWYWFKNRMLPGRFNYE